MARVCQYSGKRPSVGHRVVRRGKAKREGGIGQNVTGITKRRFLPNLKSVRVTDGKGNVTRKCVCARCLKSGKVAKA